MKKLMMLLVLAVAGSAVATTQAKDKKKKKIEKTETVAPVTLANGSDSLSYAAGKYITDGLVGYLIQQGVDTAFMADFIGGFREAVAAEDNPKQKARLMGYQIADQVNSRMLEGMKREFTDTPDTLVTGLLFRGFVDALENDTTVMSQQKASDLFRAKQAWNKEQKDEKLYGENREAGRKFLEENRDKEGVITTPSGLQYKVMVQGEGDVPQRTDKVKVHYEGRLVDGTVFDASTKHGTEPSTFRADQVIRGWTEALTMMPVGSKWQLYIPYQLAYGERNTGNIKPYSALIFDVELLGIEK